LAYAFFAAARSPELIAVAIVFTEVCISSVWDTTHAAYSVVPLASRSCTSPLGDAAASPVTVNGCDSVAAPGQWTV